MKITSLTRKIRKALPLRYCGAVIVAAGTASRMGGIDKVMAPLRGEPMILRTARTFQNCDAIREIVIVTREDLLMEVMSLCAGFSKVRGVVVGGADRPASVQAGLNNLSDRVKLVAVHDGARPLVTWQVIDRTVRAAHSYGAAAPAIPVKDTIKIVKGGIVGSTPDRNTLRAVQTPQVFDLQLLKGALLKAQKEKNPITDDCSAVEALGVPTRLTECLPENIKLTTPLDMETALAILNSRGEE